MFNLRFAARRFHPAYLILAFALFSACSPKQPATPPVAKIIPNTTVIHGDTLVDNYYWLRDKTNPEVIKYLEDENAYTKSVMKHTEKLQKKLYKEMLGRIQETDLSVPSRKDDYFYYQRTVKGKQYPIYCRKKGNLNAAEEILLDQNELAKGHSYLEVGVYNVSPDHRILAYSVDANGSEQYDLRFKDLGTGRTLSETIPNTYYGAEWANDNKTFFYTTLDSIGRPYRLFRHEIGTDPKNDALVFEEPDEAFYMNFFKTKSEEFLMIGLGSMTTTEVYFIRADQPTSQPTSIAKRKSGIEYNVDHHGDYFYIISNENALNFKLMKAPVAAFARKNWKEVIAHRTDVKLEGVDFFRNYQIVYERELGLEKILVTNLADGQSHYIDFPEPVYSVFPSNNPEFDTEVFRFTYMSMITPKSVFDYNLKTKTRELKKQDKVLGEFTSSDYVTERIFAPASDGKQIPISLVYQKGLKKDGTAPLFLYAYGSYGSSIDPTFSSSRLSLLNRGFVYAIAHIRGGGEMGRQWYDDGKMMKKKNTFTDFIACADYLIAQKYTNKDKLVASGGSAGGLLMGAIVNMRPELFKAVVVHVPFVDVINTMLDPTIPLTVIEYEEWGNPNILKEYKYMKTYSPYDNVVAKEYPNLLITAGLNDPRVAYWEPAKWTAKLRALKTDNNRLILKTNMGKGHFSATGRYDYLHDLAFEYTFVFDVLNIQN